MTRAKDILDELTKEELLAWIRTQMVRLPKRSEILSQRWEKQSGELLEAQQAETKAFAAIDFTERNRLAHLYNDATSAAEQLRLWDLIEPYEKARADHFKRYAALEARQKKVDRLYNQIEVERDRERKNG